MFMIDVRRVDMHTHTRCSDGVLSPAALVQKARAAGLSAFSVTDHDTIEGVQEAQETGRDAGMEVIAGVELSVVVEDDDVHLLGYFFDPDDEGLLRHLERGRTDRIRRVKEIVSRLNALGMELSVEEVFEQAGGEAVGRPHIAAALVEAGHVKSEQEAFERYIATGKPAYVARERVSGIDAVDLLHEAGGIAVLAHPGHWISDYVIRTLVEAGLDGIETIHPSHDKMLTGYYTSLAKRFKLLRSGGSDFHGRPNEGERLGAYSIPYPRLERLRRRAHAIQSGLERTS